MKKKHGDHFVATSGIHNGMFHLDACIRKSEATEEWDPSAEYELLTVLKDAGIEVYSGNTNPGATVDLWWNYHDDALY